MKYYLDTEFNGFGGELISLALVAEDGRSGYWVFKDFGLPVAWVADNVLPLIWKIPGFEGQKLLWGKEDAAHHVAAFLLGDPAPIIVTDWPADIRYFCELVEFPMGRMAPIFAPLTFELHRVDAYPTSLPGAVQHNAWWDAMALRHLLTTPDGSQTPPASDGEGFSEGELPTELKDLGQHPRAGGEVEAIARIVRETTGYGLAADETARRIWAALHPQPSEQDNG